MEPFLSARAAVLLGLRGGPACGLELIARLTAVTDGVKPAQGSVYPALKRLEAERLVRRLPPPAERRRGRARVDYELTIAGARAAGALRLSLQRLVRLGRSGSAQAAPDEDRRRERLLTSLELSGFAADLRSELARAGRGRK